MKHSHRLPACPDPLPPRFLSCLAEFADLFTLPTWPNVLMLLAGVILTPGRRTIAAALRILGRERDPQFCTFHRILNRAAWSSRAAASRLLLLLTASFLPAAAPVVIGLDDTIERRWGPKISARGIYRGCPVAPSFWSSTAPLPPSNSSPRWANTSASSLGCGSTPTCSPSRRQSVKAAADRRSRGSD